MIIMTIRLQSIFLYCSVPTAAKARKGGRIIWGGTITAAAGGPIFGGGLLRLPQAARHLGGDYYGSYFAFVRV